jgi:carbohydrate-selective porin OprB
MPIVLRSAAILSAALLGIAFANSRAADFEEPLSLFSQASSLLHNAAKPVGVEFFVNYFGVFQGNPVGGQSQSFAYSQYLPFGFEWKEPFGWRGGALRVSAVSGAGRNLSGSIGNAFAVSQAWDGNTLYLYQAYLVQKAFDDRLEIGIGRVSASQFFAGRAGTQFAIHGKRVRLVVRGGTVADDAGDFLDGGRVPSAGGLGRIRPLYRLGSRVE